MNNDLISRSALIEKIESTDWYHISESGNLAKGANSELHTPLFKADDIFTALENAPAVDAVIPVRCKDCKRFHRNLENDTYCDCVGGLSDPEEHDFCSYGERRADNGNEADN